MHVACPQESRSIAKRKAEEQEAAKVSRAAKKLRIDMRRRGHVRCLRKGEDTAADVKEKQLNKLATRGVVLLFNAVAQAQKQRQEANAPGGGGRVGPKAAKLNKASFLSQLQGSAAAVSAADGAAAGSVLGLGRRGKAMPVVGGSEGAPGWKVLHEGFTGLPGGAGTDWSGAVIYAGEHVDHCFISSKGFIRLLRGLIRPPIPHHFIPPSGSSKMKDWDKAQSESEDPDKIEVASEDEGGDEGW